MNLQEQIFRVKQLMNIISEQDDPVSVYWNDTSKTEDQKIQELQTILDPIVLDAKKYFYTYIKGDWFKKKVTEKIESQDLQTDNENRMKTYDQKEIQDLETFIKNVPVQFSTSYKYCESQGPKAFYETNLITMCAKYFEPNMKDMMMNVVVHEIKHGIVDYINEKRFVNLVPEDMKIGIDLLNNPSIQSYTQRGDERIAFIQNLRRFLGVDDFVSADNLKKLFKKNVKVYKLTSDNKEIPLKIKYTDDNIMRIYTGENYGTKQLLLIKNYGNSSQFKFYVNNQENYELIWILSPHSKTVFMDGQDVIEVDLNKVFDSVQELAKSTTNQDINYT